MCLCSCTSCTHGIATSAPAHNKLPAMAQEHWSMKLESVGAL